MCTSLCKFTFLQFARILSLSQSKAIHAVHFNVYIKVLFLNIPYYFNRVFSARSPALTLLASSNWSTRQSLFSERWRAERPRLVNTAAAQENVATRICQQCGSNPAVVRCGDCRPRPFFIILRIAKLHKLYYLNNAFLSRIV